LKWSSKDLFSGVKSRGSPSRRCPWLRVSGFFVVGGPALLLRYLKRGRRLWPLPIATGREKTCGLRRHRQRHPSADALVDSRARTFTSPHDGRHISVARRERLPLQAETYLAPVPGTGQESNGRSGAAELSISPGRCNNPHCRAASGCKGGRGSSNGEFASSSNPSIVVTPRGFR